MKYYFILFLAAICTIACDSEKDKLNAQKIIDLAIEASGKEKFDNAEISFEFRNIKYLSEGNCGNLIYNRIQTDSTNTIKDVYNPPINLKRYINDTLVTLQDSTASIYAESINSVMYFVQLPHRLNDNAVNKNYKGIDSINGKSYYKIAVDFDKKGGGTDFQDKYLYWFNTKNFKLDYLAYSYTVNGGGIRFREAFNARTIQGMRFVDYNNYKPKDKNLEFNSILDAFINKNLELLSKIENENIQVKVLENKC
jgi:hypothetical protein